MSNSSEVQIELRVTALSAHYKQAQGGGFIGTPDWSSNNMTPTPPQELPRPEIDPNYVNVNFSLLEDKYLGDCGSALLIKTEDAKKLGLMVGDLITIKLSKTER